jgi:phospholipid/cholesterol/gamma-HCH transport system substrate-binding protein
MNSDRKTELLVGLFLCIGLLLTGLVVIKFGKVRDYFQGTFQKRVRFDDATGIRIGSPVALGGQRVGKVKTEPRVNPPNYDTVTVDLEIFSTFQLPENVRYEIATSGLLGDAYIAIRPAPKPPTIVEDAEGKVILGTKAAGIDTLTTAATDISGDIKKVLGDVGGASVELKTALHNVNTGALSEANLASFRTSILSLESAMKNIDQDVLNAANSETLKRTLADIAETAATLKRTATSIESATNKVGPAIDRLDPVISNVNKASVTLDKTLQTFQSGAENFSVLTKTMAKGGGLFPALFTDPKLKDDFKDLIDNMRRHGVLFYRDSADKAAAEAEAAKRATPRR